MPESSEVTTDKFGIDTNAAAKADGDSNSSLNISLSEQQYIYLIKLFTLK